MLKECQTCAYSANCINGKWCRKLKCYVERRAEYFCDCVNSQSMEQ